MCGTCRYVARKLAALAGRDMSCFSPSMLSPNSTVHGSDAFAALLEERGQAGVPEAAPSATASGGSASSAARDGLRI